MRSPRDCRSGPARSAADLAAPPADRRRAGAGVLVAAVAVFAFAAGLSNALLGDDGLLVHERLAVGRTTDLLRFFTEGYWGDIHPSGLYRPLSLSLLGAQRLVFGDQPLPFHAVSLVLHALCSLTVLGLLRVLLPPAGATVGAVLFAVHPIHAEAVLTIYGQEDLWAALFFLLAVRVHLASDRRPVTMRFATLTGVLYLLALLSKEQAALLPGLLLLVRGLYLHRHARGWRRWFGWPELLLAVPIGIYIGLRLHALGLALIPLGEATVAFGYPWWARINLAVVSLGTYVRLLAVPWGQTIYYGHLRQSILGTPALEAVTLVTAAGALWMLRRPIGEQTSAMAAGWLASTLLPVANILPIGMVVGERCLYLPSVGLCLLVGAACSRLIETRPRAVPWVTGAIALAGILAAGRVAHAWRTPLAHWETTVASHPESPRAQAMLGLLLLDAVSQSGPVDRDDPRLTRAEDALDRALALNPRSPEGWQGRGRLAYLRGDCTSAIPALRQALVLRPDPEIERLVSDCR